MPDLVKIGKSTRDVSLRPLELFTKGVPLPFESVYAAKFKDVDQTEKSFHLGFKKDRVNN